MARMFRIVAALSLASGCSSLCNPADSLREIDVIEQALHQVESAKLTPEQKKLSMKAVSHVEAMVSELKGDSNMTKAQRMEKVGGAIQELQGLQSEWELSAAKTALEKVEKLPHLNAQQREVVKKVAGDVEGTVSAIEAGNLTGPAQHEKVGVAIKELTDLQREVLNASTAARVEELEREMQQKKVQLKKTELDLKLVKLQKELTEKKLLLKRLTAQKNQASDLEKERKQDAADQAMVAKLLATAKALAAKKAAPKHVEAAVAKPTSTASPLTAASSPVSGILTDLKARAKNVSDSIARMDAEEKKKEAELEQSIQGSAKGPAEAQTEATKKGQAMLKMLVKQAHRKYLKARTARESQRKELEEGVHSVETGDVAALTKLLGKMQQETKTKSSKFLY